MYKDIISYTLAPGISEEHLLTVAEAVKTQWMSKQAGFIKREIHKNSDDGYTDIVYWESKEHAKKSEADMANIPNANDRFSCYEQGSITSKNINLVSVIGG